MSTSSPGLVIRSYPAPPQEKDILAFDALMKFCTDQPGYYGIIHWVSDHPRAPITVRGPYASEDDAWLEFLDLRGNPRPNVSVYAWAIAGGNGTCWGEANR